MLEQALITHCAPTLARLKPGGMFALAGVDGAAMEREMRSLNRLLLPKGVVLTVLRRCGQSTLFYLYRPCELRAILESAMRTLRRKRRCASCAPGCAKGRVSPTKLAYSWAIRWRM